MKKIAYITALILLSFITEGQIVSTVAGAGGSNAYLDGASGQARFSAPGSIAIHSNGDVYVTDSVNHKIRKISGGNVTTFSGTGIAGNTDGTSATATLNKPTYITIDAAGNLYLSARDRIRKIDPSGNVTTFASASAIAAVLFQAGRLGEIEYDKVNNLLYAADSSGIFLKISSTGSISNFTSMFGIAKSIAAIGSGGGFYYVSSDSNIYKVLPGGITNYFLTGHGGQAIAVNGPDVYVAGNSSTNQIIEVYSPGPQQNMFLSNPGDMNGVASGAACNYLSDIRISDASTGSLMVADHYNNKIKLISYSTAASSLTNLSPQAYTLCPGTTFSLSPGDGNTNYYNWSLNGNAISNSANISGALTNTLSFNPLLPVNSGTYTMHYGDASQNKQVQVTITCYPQETLNATASSSGICSGLSATLFGSSSIYPIGSYQWSDNTGIIEHNAMAVVSPTSTTSYSLSGYDGNNCAFSNTVTVIITVNTCTGFEEYDRSNLWPDLYPNPVSDILYLGADCTYTITDLLGRTHQSGKGNSAQVSALDRGLYTIFMRGNGRTAMKRFVKL